MTEPNLTRSLLTLFTTPEKAEEIEGDLIEQAPAHGRMWLRVQLVQTWLALAFAAFRQEPGYTILLSFATYQLIHPIHSFFLYPVRLYVLHDTYLSMAVLMWVTYACFALAYYCIGAALVYFLPKFAVRASLGGSLIILLPVLTNFPLYGIYPLFAMVVPLLTGCFHMHRKRLIQRQPVIIG
jgi:hypothetical protein